MPKDSAALRARRLLAIVHMLEPDSTLSLASLARALDTTEEQIACDLELLSCCAVDQYAPETFVPVYVEDGEVVVFGELPALERAIRLSGPESRALAAALQATGIAPGDPLVAKLLEAAGALSEATEVERAIRTATSAAPAHMKVLSQALHENRTVTLSYQSGGSPIASERIVEPVSLLNERGQWYLEAYCRNAGGLRTFRVDRIREATIGTEVFSPRELSPTGSALPTEGLPVARIEFAPGEQVSERDWPGMKVVDTSERGLVVDVPYAGTRWIARRVAARLGRAVVLSPADIRDAVCAVARTYTEPPSDLPDGLG